MYVEAKEAVSEAVHSPEADVARQIQHGRGRWDLVVDLLTKLKDKFDETLFCMDPLSEKDHSYISSLFNGRELSRGLPVLGLN